MFVEPSTVEAEKLDSSSNTSVDHLTSMLSLYFLASALGATPIITNSMTSYSKYIYSTVYHKGSGHGPSFLRRFQHIPNPYHSISKMRVEGESLHIPYLLPKDLTLQGLWVSQTSNNRLWNPTT